LGLGPVRFALKSGEMGWNEGGLNPKVNCLGFNPLHPTPFHLVLKKTEQDLTCFHDSSCSGFIAIIGKKCYSILGNIKYHLKLTHGNAKKHSHVAVFLWIRREGALPALQGTRPDHSNEGSATATPRVALHVSTWGTRVRGFSRTSTHNNKKKGAATQIAAT